MSSPQASPTPKGPGGHLPSRAPSLHGPCVDTNPGRMRNVSKMQGCGAGAMRLGGGPGPSTFEGLPPAPWTRLSGHLCNARSGGNQIIFKPEIIFFIIVTDSIFFLFCVTRCVCTYIYIIYYKYQRNYISILGWEDEGGIQTMRGAYSSLSSEPAGRERCWSLPFSHGSLSCPS